MYTCTSTSVGFNCTHDYSDPCCIKRLTKKTHKPSVCTDFSKCATEILTMRYLGFFCFCIQKNINCQYIHVHMIVCMPLPYASGLTTIPNPPVIQKVQTYSKQLVQTSVASSYTVYNVIHERKTTYLRFWPVSLCCVK